MSPTPCGCSALQCIKIGDALEICDGITFDFYSGMPYMVFIVSAFVWQRKSTGYLSYILITEAATLKL